MITGPHKSASPRMHNAVIQGRGLGEEFCYVPFEIKEGDLEQAVAGLGRSILPEQM